MKNKIFISIAGFLIVIASWFVSHSKNNLGATQPNQQSLIATSSTVSVGIQENKTIFTSKTRCASRTISTVAQPIMISFSSDITPTGTVGHLQPASTTVAYEAGLYGCGAVTAYGQTASTTITVSEFRF